MCPMKGQVDKLFDRFEYNMKLLFLLGLKKSQNKGKDKSVRAARSLGANFSVFQCRIVGGKG
jgi:hypothetical protein